MSAAAPAMERQGHEDEAGETPGNATCQEVACIGEFDKAAAVVLVVGDVAAARGGGCSGIVGEEGHGGLADGVEGGEVKGRAETCAQG
ncbi:hypothetical protein PpBr36_05108 [Pyricularia pennisetigena]|uniref:hypothetical protein n=1 Tax=Pyricularia pennisetigena TaxID=1578925 RepID=UPI00114EF004|nr:hypothetical protein PpBr36_05108 [Pyricularia pennisetigena]TLS27341.1 hypothetical protein PpBr36_05108 [Pyricularia pennisetigena]